MVLPPPLSTAKIRAVFAAPAAGAAISVVSKKLVALQVPVTARPVLLKVPTVDHVNAASAATEGAVRISVTVPFKYRADHPPVVPAFQAVL